MIKYYDGRLEGLDWMAWETARDAEQIQASHDGLHRNPAMIGYRHRTLASFGDDMATLGGVGCLEHGPELGLELCVSGYTDRFEAEILRLRQFREKDSMMPRTSSRPAACPRPQRRSPPERWYQAFSCAID